MRIGTSSSTVRAMRTAASWLLFVTGSLVLTVGVCAEPLVQDRPLSIWVGALKPSNARDRAKALEALAPLGPQVPGLREALGQALYDPEQVAQAAQYLAG